MWVDYKSKAMRITHLGKRVALQGVKDQLDSCPPISSKKLQGLMKHGGVACCLQLVSTEVSAKVSDELQYICTIQNEPTEEIQPPIQELIQEFDHLFSTPTQLPPQRDADHQIHLVPGAQPVKVRPYHYSPLQKNEIESQVQQMIQNGVVRPSSSAFASPVLLVRKKDGTWRFCVDYRHLNAITQKISIHCQL